VSGVNSSANASRIVGGHMKFIIGGVIIVMVIGWLIYSNVQGAVAQYLTIEELMTQGPSDRIVRVSGLVVGETIDWDPQQLTLEFEIADEGGSVPVTFKGVRPDMFQDGAQAVVEGRYAASGVFQATDLLLKCPSKYVEE
jgi:cytochrome c-type biogenesis protein CcmE